MKLHSSQETAYLPRTSGLRVEHWNNCKILALSAVSAELNIVTMWTWSFLMKTHVKNGNDSLDNEIIKGLLSPRFWTTCCLRLSHSGTISAKDDKDNGTDQQRSSNCKLEADLFGKENDAAAHNHHNT